MSTDADDRRRAAIAQAVSTEITQRRENWPMMLEIYEEQARIARARYLAYVAAGFLPAEALQLCSTKV